MANLPDEVVLAVFKAVLTERSGEFMMKSEPLDVFAAGLAYLGVCRRWRWALLPQVYQCVSIRCSSSPSDRNKGWIRDGEEEDEKTRMATNSDLFASLNAEQLATRAAIDVRYSSCPLPALRAVSEKLRGAASRWERVKELDVVTNSDYGTAHIRRALAADCQRDIYDTSHALAEMMPNISRLLFSGSNESTIAQAVCGCLAGFYADMLVDYRSTRSVVLSERQRFLRLQSVHVNYDDERIYFIPSMYAGELRHLTLRNMPANHEWSSFATEDDSQQIMFTELQSLRLLYNRLYMDDDSGEPIEHGDDHPWTLQFPALETAAIHCTVDRCPLLEYAEFPEIMDSLHIEARPAVFRAIARRGLPAARRLSLEVSRGSGANPSVFADLDAILDSAGMSEELALCCSDRELRVVRGDITCRALTRLEVSGPVSVDAMVGLVGTLPNLVRLALWQLTFEERETNMPIPEPEESGWVAPLSTKLARLTISYHPDRYSAAEVVPAAQYMLLRAPALETFVAPHYVQERMAEFVQRFAQQAPRLAEVTLERC